MSRHYLRKKTIPLVISLLLLLITLVSNIFRQSQKSLVITSLKPSPAISTSSSQLVRVVRVIDGDTIEIEPFGSAQGKEKVRYIGIDSPELHHPKKPVQCFANEAMLKNKEIVEGKMVTLEKDISETDKYGRLLRYVKIGSPSAELFVNDYLVKEGYAYAATFPPDVKYAELFRQSQNEAMKNRNGLWTKCK